MERGEKKTTCNDGGSRLLSVSGATHNRPNSIRISDCSRNGDGPRVRSLVSYSLSIEVIEGETLLVVFYLKKLIRFGVVTLGGREGNGVLH